LSASFSEVPFRWALDKKPMIIGDAAFGSFDLLRKIEEWGGTATSSQFLWSVLSMNTPPNTWRAAANKHWLAGSHTITDKNGKKVFQQVISNAFHASEIVLAPATENSSQTESNSSSLCSQIITHNGHRLPHALLLNGDTEEDEE